MKVKYLDSRRKFEGYFTDEIISMYKTPYLEAEMSMHRFWNGQGHMVT